MFDTLILVILDESGSMTDKKSDIIGGFNNLIDNQKEIKDDKASLYLLKFNSIVNIVHEGVDLVEILPLNDSDYKPSGCTALYDAIADGIHLVEKVKKEHERVICAIMTDGEENSSKKTTLKDVKEMMLKHEKEGDWTFIYVGERPDEWTKNVEISEKNGIQFDHVNMSNNTNSAISALSSVRTSRDPQKLDLFTK